MNDLPILLKLILGLFTTLLLIKLVLFHGRDQDTRSLATQWGMFSFTLALVGYIVVYAAGLYALLWFLPLAWRVIIISIISPALAARALLDGDAIDLLKKEKELLKDEIRCLSINLGEADSRERELDRHVSELEATIHDLREGKE